MSKIKNVEQVIEGVPGWVKSFYVLIMTSIKRFLKMVHLLDKLDKKAKTNKTFHYLRSLLSIYQLDDMIELDVPWWTYSAISSIEAYIEGLDHLPTVFEYGSGASTIWLAKRSDLVVSVEHDSCWFNKLNDKLINYPNVQLLLQKPECNSDETAYQSQKMGGVNFKSYVTAINQLNQTFDIIIIDGRSRNACLAEAFSYLKPNGIIVFDNSNRARYQNMLEQGHLTVQRYYGRVPGSPFSSETAIVRVVVKSGIFRNVTTA